MWLIEGRISEPNWKRVREAEQEMGKSQTKMWSPLEANFDDPMTPHEARGQHLVPHYQSAIGCGQPTGVDIMSALLLQLRATAVVRRKQPTFIAAREFVHWPREGNVGRASPVLLDPP